MIEARVMGAGLIAPGLSGWEAGRSVLAACAEFEEREVTAPAPVNLMPRERRRASPAVRLALAVATEAVNHAEMDPKDLPSIFGWAHGDGVVVQRLLEALATTERFVSPTDFHNSVHNVALGYWTIGTGARKACTSVAAHKDTFPASLLKALAQVKCEGTPVLLVVLDTPFTEPLNSVCKTGAPFAFAFVLAPPDREGGMATIRSTYANAAAAVVPPRTDGLLELWNTNAAARALPFLEHLARQEAAALQVPYGPGGRLDLEIAPC
jgi:hypothetical protein